LKVAVKAPTHDYLARAFRDDPLRNLNVFKKIEENNSVSFTLDLCERLEHVRFDPRLAESCVERMILFSDKIDLNTFSFQMRTSVWPRSWLCLTNWALGLLNSSKLKNVQALLKQFSKRNPRAMLESFYIDLYSPASKRTQTALITNNKIWESCGFWAHEAPYSKEILKHRKLTRAPKNKVSTFRLERLLKDFFEKNSRQFMTLKEIVETNAMGHSSRQILRILKKIPHLKQQGRLKGTRYIYRPPK